MTARPLIEPMEGSERLSADDLASRREEEFLSSSIAAQQLRAAGGELIERGVCLNCQAVCTPRAVYCDPECKGEHEQRLRQLARLGKAAA